MAFNMRFYRLHDRHNIMLQHFIPAKKEEDKYIKIQEYLNLIEYFKSRDEKSYILLYILAITGARFSEVNNMKYEDFKFGTIHLTGTKTENAHRDMEANQKVIELIKKKLGKHPRRMDGCLFNLSHNGSKRFMNYAKKRTRMEHKKGVTTYALRHTHCSYLISQSIPIEYISKRLGEFVSQYYTRILRPSARRTERTAESKGTGYFFLKTLVTYWTRNIVKLL